MEQTVLRPKPLPGRGPGGSGRGGGGGDRSGPAGGPGPGGTRPGAVRHRGRRPASAVARVLVGALLVLSGAGLGATGATIAGADGAAGPERQAGAPVTAPLTAPRPAPSVPAAPPAPVPARLGVEVADGEGPGALVVGVHVPGPGFSAGLARGDVLLAFDGARVDSAADLARAVARARPGAEADLTVRHRSGVQRRVAVVPGVVT